MPTYRNDGNTTIKIHDTVVTPKNIIVSPTEINQAELTKISDEPYIALTESVHNLTFGAADEEQSITGLLGSNIVRVRNPTVDFEIRAGSSASPQFYPVVTGGFNDIINDRMFDTLFIKASGAGTITLIVIPE